MQLGLSLVFDTWKLQELTRSASSLGDRESLIIVLLGWMIRSILLMLVEGRRTLIQLRRHTALYIPVTAPVPLWQDLFNVQRIFRDIRV